MSEPGNAANAAKLLTEGATIVVWDDDPAALRTALEHLPGTPPGRLCTWVGRPGPALAAFIREILDPPVK